MVFILYNSRNVLLFAAFFSPVSQASKIHGKGTFNQLRSKLRQCDEVTDFR